ncbi:DEKNAAC104236 [Brettanomyces naardenensis]|uniref:DEKNAAC104236 n=1 Tax=Brettanomyces naardenensis TaxID=13370 RepID=A0A448YQB4_BRENA|nr:DEKNAAC104236 [Brettanomyces naardenensis]
MQAPGGGGGSSQASDRHTAGKRRRVNYNVKQIQQAQFTRNPDSEDDPKEEDNHETEEERLMSALEQKKANKRFEELNRENYNDSIKVDVPKNMTGRHSMRVSKPSIAVKRILNSKRVWSNYVDELDKKEVRRLDRMEVRPSISRTKKLCTICGNISWSSCVNCGARVCSVKCMTVHKETRCSSY